MRGFRFSFASCICLRGKSREQWKIASNRMHRSWSMAAGRELGRRRGALGGVRCDVEPDVFVSWDFAFTVSIQTERLQR